MTDRHQTPEALRQSIRKMIELLPQSSSNSTIFERPPEVNHRGFEAHEPNVAAFKCSHCRPNTDMSKNKVAYLKQHEPKLVAFGFSHCRPNADMTKNKVVYLTQLVERGHQNNKDYVQEFVAAIKELEDKVYSCYDNYAIQNVCSKDYEVIKDKYSPRSPLVKIIFDTCFIVELIYKWSYPDLAGTNDAVILRGENFQSIVRDMFVLSNQIPLFLLKKFFQLTAEEHGNFSFTEKVVSFIEKELCIGPIHINRDNMKDSKHLLAYAYDIWVNSSEFGRTIYLTVGEKAGRQRVIRNAVELRRAGVRFSGIKRPTFDVKFRRGVLEIPILSITTETECFLQNIIAYEQRFEGDKMLLVSDYCVFMDCLIQSPQDVQLLHENGVIESYLHDDEDIVSLFNRLGKRVPSSTHFCYSDLFNHLNEHCVRRWSSLKAKLRRNYFRDDNQLEAVSFMVALYLILPVTVVQTVYTVLSYYKG